MVGIRPKLDDINNAIFDMKRNSGTPSYIRMSKQTLLDLMRQAYPFEYTFQLHADYELWIQDKAAQADTLYGIKIVFDDETTGVELGT